MFLILKLLKFILKIKIKLIIIRINNNYKELYCKKIKWKKKNESVEKNNEDLSEKLKKRKLKKKQNETKLKLITNMIIITIRIKTILINKLLLQ